MAEKDETPTRGISKVKLAIGAVSLFLFVVGLKRSFRTDEGREILKSDAERMGGESGGTPRGRPGGGKRPS
jgi:hypothetical protein